MTSKATGPSKGFSLIEILVVITIIVIISAASIPLGLNFVKALQNHGGGTGNRGRNPESAGPGGQTQYQQGNPPQFQLPPGRGRTSSRAWTRVPLTGNWDGNVYPANPGICNNSAATYGMVPDPPNNVIDPNRTAGVQSPHGFPT